LRKELALERWLIRQLALRFSFRDCAVTGYHGPAAGSRGVQLSYFGNAILFHAQSFCISTPVKVMIEALNTSKLGASAKVYTISSMTIQLLSLCSAGIRRGSPTSAPVQLQPFGAFQHGSGLGTGHHSALGVHLHMQNR
jgi:hypothetical protein